MQRALNSLSRISCGSLLALLLMLCLQPPPAQCIEPFLCNCKWPIQFDEIQIENLNFEEAIEYVRQKTKKIDIYERDPSKKGANIVVKPPLSAIARHARISIRAKNITLPSLLKELGKYMAMHLKVEPFAFVFDGTSAPEEVYTRTFKVPPEFRSMKLR